MTRGKATPTERREIEDLLGTLPSDNGVAVIRWAAEAEDMRLLCRRSALRHGNAFIAYLGCPHGEWSNTLGGLAGQSPGRGGRGNRIRPASRTP